MIYSSLDNNGIPKFQRIAQLKVGDEFETRRKIKPTDKCRDCKRMYKNHGLAGGAYIDPQKEEACERFFPAKFHIGKQESVLPKRGVAGICVCGHGKIPHTYNGKTSEIGEIIPTYTGNSIVICPCQKYTPRRTEIIGGMWAKELEQKWLMDEIHGKSLVAYEQGKEAALELMGTWRHLQDVLKTYNPENYPLWRVSARVIL
ncbi:Uncharacterised protein [Candidatus Anstonella stagnisolia]|nr:Uncharacterised protein [Candidatus Anstonella stagnisolia]